jgi:hypothetical protein
MVPRSTPAFPSNTVSCATARGRRQGEIFRQTSNKHLFKKTYGLDRFGLAAGQTDDFDAVDIFQAIQVFLAKCTLANHDNLHANLRGNCRTECENRCCIILRRLGYHSTSGFRTIRRSENKWSKPPPAIRCAPIFPY